MDKKTLKLLHPEHIKASNIFEAILCNQNALLVSFHQLFLMFFFIFLISFLMFFIFIYIFTSEY